MNRTTNSARTKTAGGFAILLTSLLLSGCGGDYPRKEFTQDSDVATRIKKMVRELRDATPAARDAVIDRQTIVAGNDDGGRRAMAVGTLKKIATADNVEFLLFDRYGGSVYRVNLRVTSGETVDTVSMILVPGENGTLLWAGPN